MPKANRPHRTSRALLDPGARAAIAANRSFWAVRYTDGSIATEWSGRDWLDLPRRGRQSLRLYCPNGKFAEVGLESGRDATDRLFQLKHAVANVGIGMGGTGGISGRKTLAHIIGCCYGLDGQAICYAWDYGLKRLIGPWDDNPNSMEYGGIGPLAQAVLGIRAD